jgi:thiamine pyrophosphokinase
MRGNPVVLCADGGADTAYGYGVVPHAGIGDLDSLSSDARAKVSPEYLVCIDADNTGTDVQKVLSYAVDLGVREAKMVGFTGGRTDHWLWNLSMLKLFGDAMSLCVVDDHCEVRLVRERVKIHAQIGQKISLTPLGGEAVGITTRGLKFALNGEALALGVRDGISNEVVGSTVEIRVERGDLLVVVQREDDFEPVEWMTI